MEYFSSVFFMSAGFDGLAVYRDVLSTTDLEMGPNWRRSLRNAEMISREICLFNEQYSTDRANF
jgi:hypothetical protein